MSLRSEVGLALLLGTAVGVAVVAGTLSTGPASEMQPASTFLAGPGGAKGVYDVMALMGRPVHRRRINLFDLVTDSADRPAVLIEAAPDEPLEAGEMTQVAAFLGRGGTVVVAGGASGIMRCAGWRRLGVPVTLGRHEDTMPIISPPGVELPGVQGYLQTWETTSEDTSVAGRIVPEITEDRCPRFSARSVDTLVHTRSGHPVVVSERMVGGGQLILMGDDGWLRNRAWRTTGVPQFVLPLLTPPASGPGTGGSQIQWDEFHHGYTAGGSIWGAAWTWMTRTPGGWVLDQLIAVLLLWLAVTAVRFGPARSVIDRRRRSPLEHLDALAAGLESSDGSQTALGLIVGGLRRRLSRTGQAPGAKADEQWIAALSLAMPTPQGRGAVRRLREAFTKPGGGERVLAAANSVEDVWEELRPRTTRDAFSKP